MLLLYPLIFLASTLLLYKSSKWVIRHVLTITDMLGTSTFFTGFLILSVSTSLPELMVAIFSSLEGRAGLAAGNAFGANMVDLTVVLGVCTLFAGRIRLKRKETLDLIELLFITSLACLFIFQKGGISALQGIVLLVLFAIFVKRLYRNREEKLKHRRDRIESRRATVLKFFLSVSVLLVSARLMVFSALEIADFFMLTETFVGVVLVSLGTTLPELSVELRAVREKEYALAMGDLFGSSVTNVTLVLGIASILNPVSIDVFPLMALLPFLFASILISWYSFSRNGEIGRRTGVVLLCLYLLFLLEEFGFISIFG
jgi:cation:H+ antiporter